MEAALDMMAQRKLKVGASDHSPNPGGTKSSRLRHHYRQGAGSYLGILIQYSNASELATGSAAYGIARCGADRLRPIERFWDLLEPEILRNPC